MPFVIDYWLDTPFIGHGYASHCMPDWYFWLLRRPATIGTPLPLRWYYWYRPILILILILHIIFSHYTHSFHDFFHCHLLFSNIGFSLLLLSVSLFTYDTVIDYCQPLTHIAIGRCRQPAIATCCCHFTHDDSYYWLLMPFSLYCIFASYTLLISDLIRFSHSFSSHITINTVISLSSLPISWYFHYHITTHCAILSIAGVFVYCHYADYCCYAITLSLIHIIFADKATVMPFLATASWYWPYYGWYFAVSWLRFTTDIITNIDYAIFTPHSHWPPLIDSH